MSLTISNQPQVQHVANPEKPERKEGLTTNEIIGWAVSPGLMLCKDAVVTIADRTDEKHDELVEEYGTVGALLMGGWVTSAGLATGELLAEEAVESYQKTKNGLKKAWDYVKNLF